METNKKLLITFKTEGDKNVSISVDSQRDDVTEAEILTIMTLILSKDIFAPNGEAPYRGISF